jgi:beta-lactamase regulating signal transducer with metallopeptidase domain
VADHVAPALYFLQVHLLVATLVALGAWVLARWSHASATAKLWMWTAASLNFVVPLGGFVDGFGARDLPWAQQLAPLAWFDITLAHHLKVVEVAAVLYLGGAILLLVLLWRRIRAAHRAGAGRTAPDAPRWTVAGVSVHFGGDTGPAVAGLLRSRICLPQGIEELLTAPELEAVLLHEITHAKRRDNLLRLVQELVQCLLWFHPLIWFVGARLCLYRELSCDEAVLQRSHGRLLVSALAKLALNESGPVLQSAATTLVKQRLERLLAPARLRRPQRLANIVVGTAFIGLVFCATLFAVAHTACCLVPVR